MNKIITTVCMALCGISLPAVTPSEVNEADASGYLARAVAMYSDGNYNGCLDQLSYLTTFQLTPAQQCSHLYYEAMATLMSGDDEALELLRSYAARYPQSAEMPRIHVAMGDYYYSRSNYEDALREYRLIAQKSLTSPQRQETAMHRGYCEFEVGDREMAKTIFTDLLADDKYRSQSCYYLGYMSFGDGDMNEAKRYFMQVKDDAGSQLNSHVYLAQIFNGEHNVDKALEEAYAALRLSCSDADRAEMYRIAGESLYTLGDRESAKMYLEKYVDSTAEPLASACYAFGECLMAEGRYSDAAELFRKSCRYDDVMGQNSYYNLGLCYLQTGNEEMAVLAFQKASDMTHDARISEPALYNYIALCESGHKVPFGTLTQLCEKFLKRYPRSALSDNVRRTLGTAYMQETDYDNALRHLEKVSKHTAGTREALLYALYARGRSLTLSGQYDDALLSLDKALAQNADNTEDNRIIKGNCRLLKAQCLIAEEDINAAVQELLAARRELPRAGENYRLAEYLLAHCYFTGGDYEKAIPLYESVAKTCGDNKEMEADCYVRIADGYHYLRDFAQAEKYYDKSEATYKPSADYALWRKVQIKSAGKNSSVMMKESDRLIREYPSSIYAYRAMAMQADVHIAAGDNAKALAIYDKITVSAPESAEGRKALLSKALLLGNMGKTDEAIRA
ncbi:MAG: tetratricopeptide repeat protein, partial [Paramuribaculum sp.]|nr:tetratricopeptide repeat protein [Paramuribaculum sp.]